MVTFHYNIRLLEALGTVGSIEETYSAIFHGRGGGARGELDTMTCGQNDGVVHAFRY